MNTDIINRYVKRVLWVSVKCLAIVLLLTAFQQVAQSQEDLYNKVLSTLCITMLMYSILKPVKVGRKYTDIKKKNLIVKNTSSLGLLDKVLVKILYYSSITLGLVLFFNLVIQVPIYLNTTEPYVVAMVVALSLCLINILFLTTNLLLDLKVRKAYSTLYVPETVNISENLKEGVKKALKVSLG